MASPLSLPSPFRCHSSSKKQRNPLVKKILGLQAPMELASSIFIIWDPLASHPRTLIHNSFFSGPSVCIELHDYNEPSLLNFSSLRTLHLSNTSYSPAISFVPKWIFKLKKLVSLQLRGNEFPGPILGGIRNLTLLQNLDLFENSFSSSIPDCLYGLHISSSRT